MQKVLVALLGVALGGPVCAQQSKQLDYPALLRRLAEVDWLWQPPQEGERCVQFSSFDRASLAGPQHQTAWYANDDRGHYLRVEERDGHQEFVMVDADGPGVLAQLWSANPTGLLHFDIDGQRVWTVDFAQLCSGAVPGLGEPWAGMRGKGGNCSLPIPFGKHLTVSATAGELYYHADVLTCAAGTVVPTFSPQMLTQHAATIREVGMSLDDSCSCPMPSAAEPPPCWRVVVPAQRVVRSVNVYVRVGAADLPPDSLTEGLRGVLLVVRCGNEETVRVPVGDFFGVGGKAVPYRGAMLSFDGWGHCRFPMPMPDGGEIELVSDDGVPVASRAPQLRLLVQHEATTFAEPPLLFHASFHRQAGTPSRPFSDHLVLDAKGAGRFVGTSLLVKNPSRIWWGEGDEKFFVDGEAFPSWFGTGTEDYFGFAWCCPEPFASPLHAQVQCDGPMNYGYTSLHRIHLLDSVPFPRSFRFELERWHWLDNVQVDYQSVAYWYGAAGATSGLPAVPPAAERALVPMPPPSAFVVADAIEGESLRIVSCSGRGVCELQDLTVIENTFSHDAQLWWRDGKPGDALVLAVPVAEAARYRVVAAFAQADDFGIVQVSMHGEPLGEAVDGYAERVQSTGPRELGSLRLPQGEVELRLELKGKHPKAKSRYMVGLDYLRLEKLP